MDIVDELRRRIGALPEGEHNVGLNSVLRHIETGFRHYNRGRDDGDETAFTDTIYRTNQAFEGSIKEAYRVLANLEPDKKNVNEIERYFTKYNIFRTRVLDQFTNYRQVWRNPSTHEYNLDFNDSEAFLALVSVTGFACLLLDQMIEKTSYDAAQSLIQNVADPILNHPDEDLLLQTTNMILQFCTDPMMILPSQSQEAQLIGRLHAYLNKYAPSTNIIIDQLLSPQGSARPDMIIERSGSKLILELSRGDRLFRRQDAYRLIDYLNISEIKEGVFFYFPHTVERMATIRNERFDVSQRINFIFPESGEGQENLLII